MAEWAANGRIVAEAACIGHLSDASSVSTFSFSWYDRYWRWRDCFNVLGRCYDPDSQQVFLEQAGLVWGTFAMICALLAVLFAWRALRRRGRRACRQELANKFSLLALLRRSFW